MTPNEQEMARAGFALLSNIQIAIETSGLSYPQAATCLLVLICEMIQTAPDYDDGMPSAFLDRVLPQAIETGKARQAVMQKSGQTTGTMQ